MEPVTHILTGACLARTGLNRRAAYTTLAMVVAAEFPDIDTLWSLRGPVVAFQHHRGITHTFLGIPFEAALIVAGIYGQHRWRLARAGRQGPARAHATDSPAGSGQPLSRKPLTAAPVRWGLLYGFTLLALLSHLWLDYTNNYGLRPFFPFNPRWYAASITFIFDPAMFVLLLAALVLPPLFRLVGAEVGTRKQPFAARGWSVAALLGVCALWGWRAAEHAAAEQIASAQSYSLQHFESAEPSLTQAIGSPSEPPASADIPGPLPNAPPPQILQAQRTHTSPDPLNPFRWYSVVDFGPLYQLGTIDVRTGAFVPQQAIEMKAQTSPAALAAQRSLLGRVYLDWSPMPFIDLASRDSSPPEEDAEPSLNRTVITFRDPRFMGESPWLHTGRTSSPLTGTVWLDAHGNVVRQAMDSKFQH